MALLSLAVPSAFSVIVVIVILVALLLLSYRRTNVPAGLSLPPGPWGLPVLGAAFRLSEENFKDFTKLSKEYGDIFSLYIGSRLVVVLNGSDVIHEALVKNSTAFAGRPDLFSMRKASDGGRGIIHCNYGKKWQVLRKTSVSAIHKYLATKDVIQSILGKNRDYLINQLKTYQGQVHDVLPVLKSTTAGVILGILFGDSCDKQDFDKVLAISDGFREAVGRGLAVDVMPWLEYFPNASIDKLVELMDDTKELISRLYYENRVTYTKEKIRNLADSLLEGIEKLKVERTNENHQTDGNSNVRYQDLPTEDIDSIMTLTDLFGAGFDTSSITLYFAVAYLAAYPEVQIKMQQELDQVIGRERKPEVNDIKDLHYTKAFYYELMRITSLVPTSVPHSTTADVKLGGYFIPKGTVIFVNLWSVLRNPEMWKDPEMFKPSRFLDDNGHVVHAKNNPNFLPFGTGRRMCPGMNLAESEIPFLLANLVHQFDFTNKKLQESKDIKISIGLTLKPENFSVLIKQR